MRRKMYVARMGRDYKLVVRKADGKNNSGDLGVDGRIPLK
jgi:hypothetical protein